MRNLLRRLRHRRFAADLEEELEFHRHMAERDLGDAAAAQRALGNEVLMREESRAVWIAPWLESVWQDFRYAVRSLRQSPGFTLTAVGALALAIGVNTSYFTVFNAIAIRPWPVADPDRVITVFSRSPLDRPGGFSLAEYRYIGEHARTLAGTAAYRGSAVRFGFETAGKTSPVQFVSSNFFDVLGTGMSAGRGFRSDEDRPQSPEAVTVLGFQTWRTRFGADPAIVGKTVRMENVPFLVVGVTTEEFTGVTAGETAAYLPLSSMRLLPREQTHALKFLTEPGHCCSSVTARLAPERTRGDAKAEIDTLMRQFRATHGMDVRTSEIGGTQLFFVPGAKTEMHVGFGLLYIGVMLLLLLACANVGNLCLARAAARSRELAVRGALGAGRWRLIRQLLTEGLTVTAAAVIPGVAIAFWLPRALIVGMTDDAPSLSLRPDNTVLLYAVVLGGLCTLLFALTPALAGTRGDLHVALKSGNSGAGSRFRLRMTLLGVQTAMSVVLLVAAGLLARGVQRIATADPGFAVNDVTALELDLPAEMYADSKVKLLSEAVQRELAGTPQVAVTMNVPLSNVRHATGVRVPGRMDGREIDMVQLNEASPGYFEVLRIPLMEGREFTAADAGQNRVIVNESFARKYWPAESAAGKTIAIGQTQEIIGVVRDAQTSTLGKAAPAFYRLLSGDFVPVVLARHKPEILERAKAALLRAEPRAEIRFVPLRTRFDRHVRPARIGAAIAGALSLFGLGLASMGVFGVCAYLVQQRQREIGVRVALGARPASVVGFVLGAHGRAIGFGLVAGCIGAVAVSRLLEGNLYGVSPLDPVAYLGVLAVMAGAGAAATAVPALRALRLDPVSALRCD